MKLKNLEYFLLSSTSKTFNAEEKQLTNIYINLSLTMPEEADIPDDQMPQIVKLMEKSKSDKTISEKMIQNINFKFKCAVLSKPNQSYIQQFWTEGYNGSFAKSISSFYCSDAFDSTLTIHAYDEKRSDKSQAHQITRQLVDCSKGTVTHEITLGEDVVMSDFKKYQNNIFFSATSRTRTDIKATNGIWEYDCNTNTYTCVIPFDNDSWIRKYRLFTVGKVTNAIVEESRNSEYNKHKRLKRFTRADDSKAAFKKEPEEIITDEYIHGMEIIGEGKNSQLVLCY